MISLSRCFLILLLLPATALATTKTVTVETSSPYGIEQTLLKIATGAARVSTDFRVPDAILAPETDLVSGIKGLGDNLTVWIDGEEVDIRIITNYEAAKVSGLMLWNERTAENFLVFATDVGKLIKSAKSFIQIERMIRAFIRDDGAVEGSFAYQYSFWFRPEGMRDKVLVTRYTEVKDDRLYLYTKLHSAGGYLDWAELKITATESDRGTKIVGVLTASTWLGNRCCLVRNAVNRRMPDMMCSKLWEVEKKARGLAEQGEHDLFKAVEVFVDTVSRRGLR